MKNPHFPKLVAELRARMRAGAIVELEDIAIAAVDLKERRQAQAFCLYWWGFDPETVAALVLTGRVEVLAARERSTMRAVAMEMGLSAHQAVDDLLNRAYPHLVARLMAMKCA
jgi:hypothetical protein